MNCIWSHSVETERLGSSTLKSKTLTLDKNFSQSNYGLFGLIFQRVMQRGVSWRKRTQRETGESFEQFCVISIDYGSGYRPRKSAFDLFNGHAALLLWSLSLLLF